ncbi:subtilisin-like protein [Fomes fomentarius]|nr:subtilisin-like protein [Fomes fomentarius]
MLSAGTVLLALVAASLASPITYQVQPDLLDGFKAVGPASPETTISFTIALPSSNMDGLHAALFDVSDPASPHYGHWLSKEEVEKFVAPKPESTKAVLAWLKKANIAPDRTSPAGDMLRVSVPVKQANALFNANYTEFLSHETSTTLVRTLSYSVPADIDKHLSFIYPTNQFILPAVNKPSIQVIPDSTAATPPQSCASQITPQCLQTLYNIPTTAATSAGNAISVAGFLQEIANLTDLQQFASALGTTNRNPTFNIVSIDGGITTGTGTIEASLDIQYTAGLTTNVSTTFHSVGDSSVQGFLDYAAFLAGQNPSPSVVTVSYGFTEPGFQSSTSLANSFCNAYAALGARGTTVLFASGDGGVSGSQPTSACNGKAFIPTFPSGCPMLTSVGATTGFSPETAASLSSGGFSNIFARPTYQASAVQTYLNALGTTNAGKFNTTGRGFPDVSTQGQHYIVNAGQTFFLVDGTSCSSPTFASVIAYVNDARIKAGKAKLGFLNPVLYANPGLFNDVTSGSNPGCGTEGFPAGAGWDPVTGLGTPDFNKLLALP